MNFQVLKELPVKLIVAGEFYTDSKPYFDIIEKYNLRDRLIMVNDFIPDSDVSKYFCACDVVVQPYKNATQSGVSQIAYHFNKPIITTRVGGLAEVIPDNVVGYVIEPKAEEISKTIVKYFNLNKEAEFVKNVQTEKAKYSWEKLLESIEQVVKLIK
jgi:glycosyltransferase involved in cell wall biosynthesis